MKIWLVHGWRTRGEYFDHLIPCLEAIGLEADDLDYGRTFWPWSTRAASKAAANSLASVSEPGDIAVGHSKGAHVIHRALELGAPLSQALYLSPALNRDAPAPGESVKTIHVFHTIHDWACRAARYWPFSLWGSMGMRGATSGAPYENHDYSNLIGGHSEWFETPKWLAVEIKHALFPAREKTI